MKKHLSQGEVFLLYLNAYIHLSSKAVKKKKKKEEKEVLHSRAHIHGRPWRTHTGEGEKCEEEGGRGDLTRASIALSLCASSGREAKKSEYTSEDEHGKEIRYV